MTHFKAPPLDQHMPAPSNANDGRKIPLALIGAMALLMVAGMALTACDSGGTTNAPSNNETSAPSDSN